MAVSKSLRFDVLRRDEYRCRYCGAKAPHVALEVDHVIPRSRGGEDTLDNLVAACFSCNRGKQDKDARIMEEWEYRGYISWEDWFERACGCEALELPDSLPIWLLPKREPQQHFSRRFDPCAESVGIPKATAFDWSMTPAKVLALAETFDTMEAF